MSNETPTRAGDAPLAVNLEAGQDYYWCACGKSASQPFCDGAHEGSSFTPMSFKVEESTEAHLCTCKCTKNPPYCDGSHASES